MLSKHLLIIRNDDADDPYDVVHDGCPTVAVFGGRVREYVCPVGIVISNEGLPEALPPEWIALPSGEYPIRYWHEGTGELLVDGIELEEGNGS